MLKRPSTRRRSNTEPLELNLVPMLDALVTLIAFLLFSVSFLSLVSIETPVPRTSKVINNTAQKKPLQLTVTIEESHLLVWSPFNRISTQRINHTDEGKPDYEKLHQVILGVKEKFPEENQVVLSPSEGVTYDSLIAVMDAVRMRIPSDAPLYVKDEKTGISQLTKALFPNIVFGNLLGGR